MFLKALLVAIVIFGSVTNAIAQSQAPTTVVVNGAEQTPSLVIGWNYVRAANCTGYNGVFYLIDTNGGVWWSSDKDVLVALAPACQSGNWIGFHIINGNGTWDQLYTFSFK